VSEADERMHVPGPDDELAQWEADFLERLAAEQQARSPVPLIIAGACVLAVVSFTLGVILGGG
jgi:hypothetical protein